MKSTYKMHLMYDGTNYSGWQIQPHALSIQQLVQDAVRVVTREEINVIGSGRTDAGVHALDQVAHFRLETPIAKLDSFHRSLNGILPHDIRVAVVEPAPVEFHSQRSAIAKEYHYHIRTGTFVSPFEKNYVWHMQHRINMAILHEACALFVGEHDFSSFTNSAHLGACAKNPVRNVSKIAVCEELGGFRLEFKANGFMYKMVRNIVGMLIEVASNKRTLEEIPHLLQAKDRRLAASGAPANGLFLVKVFYNAS